MPYKNLRRHVWAEISKQNFIHNLLLIKRRLKTNVELLIVIKADAYGHGALELAQVAIENGISYFGVATFDEAMELRERFREARILVLGYTLPNNAKEAVIHNIELCVYDKHVAEILNRIAKQHNMQANIHIKLDTGMNRIGYECNKKNLEEIKEILAFSNLDIKGIFTHFATADSNDLSYTEEQYNRFQDFISLLQKKHIPLHCANSAAIINAEYSHLDIVRLGIVMYGLKPRVDMDMKGLDLKAVMSLKANIIHIKDIEKHQSVGYGRTFIASENTRVATLPIGYADGYMRLLSNKAEVLIQGRRAKIIGNICMDQCMIDISQVDAKIGDCVTLFGYDSIGNEIKVDELAAQINTIGYEMVCAVSKRVPRVYI